MRKNYIWIFCVMFFGLVAIFLHSQFEAQAQQGCEIQNGTDPCHRDDIGNPEIPGQGNLHCVNSVCETCLEVSPESCNSIDDNCNGQVDEGQSCAGNRYCSQAYCCPVGGTDQGSLNTPGDDPCDHVDNDGDTLIDEVNSCLRQDLNPGEGNFRCESGTCQTCLEALQESCNLVDDDCDGEVDEGATCPDGQSCVDGRCCAPTAEQQAAILARQQGNNANGGGGASASASGCSLIP